MAHQLPIANVAGGSTTFEIVSDQSKQQDNEANGREVSTGYFSTIGARLLRGRWFNELDDSSEPHVAIVNRTFAQKYCAGSDPLRKQLRFDPSLPSVEIVGVVDDLREGSLDSEVQPAIYTPFDQSPDPSFYVVARTGQTPESVLASLEATIHNIDSDILAAGGETMEDRIHNFKQPICIAPLRGFQVVLPFCAPLGVIGLYGVIAYSVRQQTLEIGIRIALGASRESVYRLILTEAWR